MPELAKDKALPPLEWLRVFEAAGRLGSFTAAAGELNLTQAAVSQRIRNLERWLGRDLFVRKPRGVDLTLDGEAYLPHVSAALAGLARRTADLFTSARRAISIAAMPSHVELLVLPRLGGFLALHPGLEINFASIFRGRDFDESAAGLHLRYGKGVWVGRTAVLLHQEVLAPVCAPELAGLGCGHRIRDARQGALAV
jgi:LysR family glycine cleavage system transcriptional activator